MGQNYSRRLPPISSSNAYNLDTEKLVKPNIKTSNSSKGEDKLEKQAAITSASSAKTGENLSKVVETVKEAKENKVKKPHRYDDITKEVEKTLKGFSEEMVRDGIFLKNRKKKYWIEERTGYNCFILFARDLQIAWGDDDKYWGWFIMKDNSDAEIEVARLFDVCWLEVRGQFDASYPTPGVTYEVLFMVMMEPGYGWAVPVNLKLKLPNGGVAERREVLKEKPLWQWIQLKVGEFMAAELAGDINFSLEETQGGQWKRGLVIKGVVVRPKK